MVISQCASLEEVNKRVDKLRDRIRDGRMRSEAMRTRLRVDGKTSFFSSSAVESCTEPSPPIATPVAAIKEEEVVLA